MDCVISLDAYLADHQSAAPSPPSASKSAQAAPLAPRAVGARSSKYIVLLHEKYQALGIPRPEFSFTGDSQIGWRGKVIFSGLFRGEEEGSGALVLEEKAFFGTKQEAKEKLSERTFEELERLEKEGKVRKRPKTKTAKEVVEVQRAAKREKGPGVNYVGLLLEFQRSTNGPQPTYMDYTLGNQHSCEAIMDGYPDPYGSKETYFSSKKEARQAAARCVVEHFKANRQWPDSYSEMGGIKKKQKVVQTHSPSRVGSLSNANADATTRPGSPSGGSYAQQVASLATQLGLNTPTWNITSAEKAPGFHSVTCSFTDGGALEGPFGEVQHIFGKKKAKEECARLTLEVLRKERERRMEYGRKMMEGIGSEIDGEEGFESAVEAQNPR
ncbi:hypothetical protein K458DRAFT_310227 [Lentithecium fluviatile CBS 122367]|uniref:DRBM domain-containing protein n=1 Tax=Lentithecium fluviatile CBS 122367 TaxID=1168545 RepID=A0A6G1IS07_9PLEO|nr:hypothetical protein K458DRAFT_310227 [Lentithecium fluviatile CBS 122367]